MYGPANILLAASGATVGFRKTMPLLLGINVMCLIQSLSIGAGLGELLYVYPGLNIILKYAGAIFMLYLAFKLFRMTGVKSGGSYGRNVLGWRFAGTI